MQKMLFIESAGGGVLFVNGQFMGPMERDGQVFPCGRNEEIYIQLFPFGESMPLTAKLILRDGRVAALEPEVNGFALLWPDGIIQLELRLRPEYYEHGRQAENVVPNALLRYLNMQLAGDEQARFLLLQDAHSLLDLSEYHAAVPLRFAPHGADERYDMQAGLVRRIAPNIACVDAALAMTVPAGQGRRLIEKIEILRT